MLDADIQLRLSRLNLDAAFTVASGEVLALLGPNGSGKSTTLRALGEFGATITFAGNLPGKTQTVPLAVYISQSSGKMDEAIALSLVLVVVSLVVMIFTRGRSRTS